MTRLIVRARRARDRGQDGSIMLALLAIIVLTSAALVGLSTLVTSQSTARHDIAFEQALAGAETGLDQLVAQIRQDPTAASVSPQSGTDSTTGAQFSASATTSGGTWTVTSSGTAQHGTSTVTRRVQETVTTGKLLSYGLVGVSSLTLGGNGGDSGIDTYDSSVSSDVCDSGGGLQSMGYQGPSMCHPASPADGPLATGGPLSMVGTDISNVSEADVYNAPVAGYSSDNPDALGRCVGDASTCSNSKVVLRHDGLDYPLSDMCSNGVGAGANAYDGSYALAANAVYSYTDVTLNATAIANLANVSGSQLVICFSGTLTIPPLLPLNATTASLVPLRLDPRPPSTLLLISTAPPNGGNPPSINLGLGLNSETSLSAVVYAPNATCTANGHVDLYGALICNTVSASHGIDVHYDKQVGSLPFEQPVTISGWRELH